MANPHAALAVSDRFVGDDERAHAADERECREGGDRDCDGDEDQEEGGADRPSPEDAAGRHAKERNVAEQVQSDASAEGDRGYEIERTMDVVQRRLEAEGEEDNARDHR
jgi:hypothetical protein